MSAYRCNCGREFPSHLARTAHAATCPSVCCNDGPVGHTQQQHHDASPCYDQACPMEHDEPRRLGGFGGSWVEGTCRARFYVHAPHKVYAGVDAAGIVWTDCPGTGIWPIPAPDDVTLTGGSTRKPTEATDGNAPSPISENAGEHSLGDA